MDWLEDSLFQNKRLPEDKYSHVVTLKALKDKERLEKKIAKGVEEEERAVNESRFRWPLTTYLSSTGAVENLRGWLCTNIMYELTQNSDQSDLYHVYWDPSDLFRYDITVSRDDEEMGVIGERYVVKVSGYPQIPFHSDNILNV